MPIREPLPKFLEVYWDYSFWKLSTFSAFFSFLWNCWVADFKFRRVLRYIEVSGLLLMSLEATDNYPFTLSWYIYLDWLSIFWSTMTENMLEG